MRVETEAPTAKTSCSDFNFVLQFRAVVWTSCLRCFLSRGCFFCFVCFLFVCLFVFCLFCFVCFVFVFVFATKSFSAF